MSGLEWEKRYLHWLCRNPQIGAVTIRRLGEVFGSYENVYYNIEESRLRQVKGIRRAQVEALLGWKEHFAQEEERYRELEEKKIRFVTPLDSDYPEKLRQIDDYPMGLFVRGQLPPAKRPAVAVVGARGSSVYGEQLAEKFAEILASEEVSVISGLAAGIDAAAHRGALRADKPSYAVLGCGVNICYPSQNFPLYEAMTDCGGILSEFPPDTAPKAQHFPMRNRIISGLSDLVLVVEAKKKSGSLITAGLALDQGREVFAIPGRVTDPLSEGCNRLIQEGAHMAISPSDILECLGLKCQKEFKIREKELNGLAKSEKLLYSFLDFKPKHLDEIAEKSGLSLSECMGILLELELGGYVYRSANHYYGKKI
ncbi:MAG: DNA-processing protein DprA [Clostridiales bacterium]|nr:DNA-processing protein DprA [Clostridiales bacterium]